MSEEDELQKEAEDLKKELDELREQVKVHEETMSKEPKKKASKTKNRSNVQKKAKKKLDDVLDPDRLALSKEQILEFCDEVLEKWGEEPVKNSKQIFAMNAVKTSILWTDEETLKQIWGEILKWSFDLFFKNALAQAKEGEEGWAKTFEKIGQKKGL